MDVVDTLRILFPRRTAWLLLALWPPVAAAQTSFLNVTSSLPDLQFPSWGVSWIDYDGDGRLDLFFGHAGSAGEHRLLRQTDGGFVRVDVAGFAGSPAMIGHSWGDYDNDGDPDLMAAGGRSVLYRNDGNDTFTPMDTGVVGEQEANRGWSPAWGDYDNDGWLDLVIAHASGFVSGGGIPNTLLHNAGDGTFTRVTESPVVEGRDTYTIPSWADYDRDGDLDLFIGSGPASGAVGPDHLYRNRLTETGEARFERITGVNIADDDRDGQVMNWVDYDNDGDFDLFVTNYLGTNDPQYVSRPPDLYRNDGAGVFTRITDDPLTQSANGNDLANVWGDLDNDGDLDVLIVTSRAVAASGIGEERLFFNNGDGTFTRAGRVANITAVSTTSAGASLGDYDDDGDLDVAVTGISPSAPQNRLFRNTLPSSNSRRWLKLRLVGTASNRSALGTVVQVTATIGGEPVTQLRQVSAQDSFGGQNSLTVHVGLGDARLVDTLTIHWPSGREDVVERVAPNQTVTVVEGEPFGGMVVAVDATPAVPGGFAVRAVYPNPVPDEAALVLDLPAPATVRGAVFDVLGRRVLDLPPRVVASGPAQRVPLDASMLPRGVYLVRLTAETSGATHVAAGRFVR